MIVTDNLSPLRDVTRPAHVCWVVDDDAAYVGHAHRLLSCAKDAARKPLAIGPHGSPLDDLGRVAAATIDPRLSVPDGGALRPETMSTALCEQAALAQAEGFEGICVVADLDWLAPADPTTDEIIELELLLDQVVSELDATVVCAYRRSSFDVDTIAGARSVHPVDVGSDAPPLFRLVAGEDGSWRLSGEIDLAVTSHLTAALAAVTPPAGCALDVTGLEFIDVCGMTALADAARRSNANVRLLGASPILQRHWQLARFDDYAPTVEFVA